MTYNIIGDVHGREAVLDLLDPFYTNVLVGDYFAPYHQSITFEKQKEIFNRIIEFKKAFPNTVLLLGNH